MNIDKIKNVLAEEGFRPEVDEDGDLLFKYEGSTYFIDTEDDDKYFIKIVLPNFWEIESEEERNLASKVALETTASVKAAKVFPVNDDMWAAVEFFLPNEEALAPILSRLLDVVSGTAGMFAEGMQAES
ncbi:hypothetical protein [Maridesulfovibrio sp.]|uniref:hypothetical protein n=1 Tax=Maridesulfovibrio sp. TaxID=2795000 RepID=UPI002A1889DA|nr:hypothetical protein [Maridesulfovibrio sp.]